MRFRILLGLLYAPNPFGAYRTLIDYPIVAMRTSYKRGYLVQALTFSSRWHMLSTWSSHNWNPMFCIDSFTVSSDLNFSTWKKLHQSLLGVTFFKTNQTTFMTIIGFNSMQMNLYKNDNLMIILQSDSLTQTPKHYTQWRNISKILPQDPITLMYSVYSQRGQ